MKRKSRDKGCDGSASRELAYRPLWEKRGLHSQIPTKKHGEKWSETQQHSQLRPHPENLIIQILAKVRSKDNGRCYPCTFR